MESDARLELRFEDAFAALELCLDDPCKWSTSAMLYYRVREVALAAIDLVEDPLLRSAEDAQLAIDSLRFYVNAHVLAFMAYPPRRPLTVAYTAARVIRRSMSAARKAAA